VIASTTTTLKKNAFLRIVSPFILNLPLMVLINIDEAYVTKEVL
jgi:hypothetical protein